MTTYVLLHGGGMGGWVWKFVAEGLRERGHGVHAPTFTGFGERIHLISRSITNSTHVSDVVNLLECEEVEEAVLVAHSYAGVVAPGIQRAAAERISRIVYIDAIVLRAGECVAEALGFMSCGEAQEMAKLLARGEGPVGAGVPDQVRAMADVEPQRMSVDRDAWVFRHLTDMPLSCNVDPVSVGANDIDCPVDYLTVPHTMMKPMHQRARDLGWNVIDLDGDCDHMVHVGAPETVVEHLLAARPGL